MTMQPGLEHDEGKVGGGVIITNEAHDPLSTVSTAFSAGYD
jgi:hypothetical protein